MSAGMNILLLGCGGQVGWELQRALAPLGQVLAHDADTANFTQPHQVAELVREHLAAHGFGQIEVTVTLEGAATRLDVDDPWVEWASGSIARSVGQTPTVLPNLAGSLPNDVFADLLGLPTLWVPHSYAACAQHAPNEHLLAPVVREGLQLMAGLFWDLGEPNGVPWRRNTPTHASPL